MAKKVIFTLIDDCDGESAAAETILFALDGTQYEIDLSADNAEKMREQDDPVLPYLIEGLENTDTQQKPTNAGNFALDAATTVVGQCSRRAQLGMDFEVQLTLAIRPKSSTGGAVAITVRRGHLGNKRSKPTPHLRVLSDERLALASYVAGPVTGRQFR